MLWLLLAGATGYALAPDDKETVVIEKQVQVQQQPPVVQVVCVNEKGVAVICPQQTQPQVEVNAVKQKE